VLDRWPQVSARLDERCIRQIVAHKHELRRIDRVLGMADAQAPGSFWRGVSAWVTMALKRDIQPNRHQQRHIDSLAQVRRLQRDQVQGTAEPPLGTPRRPPTPKSRPRLAAMTAESE
jgi:hypothetical protein